MLRACSHLQDRGHAVYSCDEDAATCLEELPCQCLPAFFAPAKILRKPRCAKVLSKVSSQLCTAKHQAEIKHRGAPEAVSGHSCCCTSPTLKRLVYGVPAPQLQTPPERLAVCQKVAVEAQKAYSWC